ncbi:MAG: DUF5723 family protein [Bacteroidales bacterium]|nr:DUF5723 family protein [Bacteroidales bacterium]MCF8403542.1 DUF5723 family protein [Bacteroidales bacterium]
MKKLHPIVLLFCVYIFPLVSFSQNQSGAFTVTGAGYSTAVVTDYQCLGINPANLGWKRNNHLMNVGIGEADFTIYSEPLKRTLVNDLFSTGKTFTDEERQEAVENFTNTKLQVEGNISGFGVSFQDDKIGGFGFSVKERVMWDSNLNEESADILFNGYNAAYFDTVYFDPQTGEYTGEAFDPEKVTDLFEGTSLQVVWFREYNFSYGRAILNNENFSLYGGVGFKYLEGYSLFNYSYQGGVLTALSSLNPVLQVDYDAPSPSKIEGNNYQKVGQGFGLDFGVSALLFNQLRLSLALTDIGSIKWDGNVYTGEDTDLTDIQTAGIDNYNIFELDDNVAFDNLKWGGWEGLESRSTDLPMSLRAGAAYVLNEKFEFGTEFYVPMNETPGSYDKMIVGLGTRISPVKWFRGSIGMVTGGETGTNIPVGISFLPFNNDSFSWELGIAVRDITTYFSQDKPTVSFAMGLMRFSFGSMGNSQTE